MNVNTLSKRMIKELARKHADAGVELNQWFAVTLKASWKNIDDVRLNFKDADQVGRVLIFNVRHNTYRLIVKMDYKYKMLMVKQLLTHKEYERNEWKKWC